MRKFQTKNEDVSEIFVVIYVLARILLFQICMLRLDVSEWTQLNWSHISWLETPNVIAITQAINC